MNVFSVASSNFVRTWGVHHSLAIQKGSKGAQMWMDAGVCADHAGDLHFTLNTIAMRWLSMNIRGKLHGTIYYHITLNLRKVALQAFFWRLINVENQRSHNLHSVVCGRDRIYSRRLHIIDDSRGVTTIESIDSTSTCWHR